MKTFEQIQQRGAQNRAELVALVKKAARAGTTKEGAVVLGTGLVGFAGSASAAVDTTSILAAISAAFDNAESVGVGIVIGVAGLIVLGLIIKVLGLA